MAQPTKHADDHHPDFGPDPLTWMQNKKPWFRQMLGFASPLTPLNIPDGSAFTLQFDEFEFGDGGDAYFGAITGPDRFSFLAENMRVGLIAEVWWSDDPGSVLMQVHDGGSVSAGLPGVGLSTQLGSTTAFHWEWRCSGAAVEIKLAHSSPTDQTIEAAYVELCYEGSWSGTDPHDSDPDF